MVNLYAPSGIGDIYWLLMKIYKSADEITLHVPSGKGDLVERSKFLLALPKIKKIIADGPQYEKLKTVAEKEYYNYSELKNDMFLECNTWLENGKRIDEYLPVFDTEYKLPWDIGPTEIKRGTKFFIKGKKNIVVYTSGVKNNQNSSVGPNWSYKNWSNLFMELGKIDDVNLIWIGAGYDSQILNYIQCDKCHIDDNPRNIIAALRHCDGFISYQSGLSCISVAESIPTAMIYFDKLKKMKNSFCPRSNIGNDEIYLPLYFGENPESAIIDWIKKIKKRNLI